MKIKISKNRTNESIFNSIVTLYKREPNDNAAFYKEKKDGRVIKTLISSVNEEEQSITFGDDNTYILSEGEEQGETEINFSEKGAVLFEQLRQGKRLNSPDSGWAYMRDEVAKLYHQKYFTIEYAVNGNDQTQTCESDCRALLDALVIVMKVPYDFELTSQDIVNDTYYSAKLKIEADLGVGLTVPLICRIYYKYFEGKNGENSLKILSREQARFVHEGFNRNVDKNGRTDGNCIASAVQTRLHEDLNSKGSSDEEIDRLFTDCVLFTDESLRVLEEPIRKNKGADKLELRCTDIKLKSIAKITWPHLRYTVRSSGKPIFNMDYSISGIALSCLNCMHVQESGLSDTLIENNMICFPAGDKEKMNGKFSIYSTVEGKDDKSKNGILAALLENYDPDTGKEFQIREDIKESNLFKHLIAEPECNRNPGSVGQCNRLVCECQKLENGMCKDCPYPEIVYLDPYSGKRKPTSELFYDANEMKMIERVGNNGEIEEGECGVCRRSFRKDKLTPQSNSSEEYLFCPTCLKLENTADKNPEGKHLYKKYAKIFNPIIRVTALFEKVKLCVEDSGVLMFKIGKKYYKFDKLAITDSGYLKSAERVIPKQNKQ